MAQLELNGLGKTYAGGVRAVRDIHAVVEDGEFVVLVGPSGCGKSTILRMIAGLETITEGELRIDGIRVNETEPGARDIAMVFQNYALYPHMSVRGNMEYGLRNEGRPRAEINQRIDEAARMLQLTALLDRQPRQLSGGQRQRVAMGRAIVRNPKVFLFDEPLSNLDAKLRTQLRAELKALHRKLGATFIYVTHDQVEAMSLADRIAILNGGEIQQLAAPLEIYRRPANRFVAEFIGNPAMNILEGHMSDDGWVLMDQGQPLLRLPSPIADRAGQPLAIGIRPEHLHPAPLGEGQQTHALASLQVKVDFTEHLGADCIVHARLENGATVALRLGGNARAIAADSPLSLCADPADLHLFDRQSGQRI
jgi:sn-glycerol 3-phosphate transport system ATP-binding protein